MRAERIDRLINTPNNQDFFGDAQTASEYANNVGLPNRFSDDNPYAQQFAYARNKQDLYALRNSAIEWESNRQAVLEQRAYDDPRAQLQRQRAAGLNPDLASSGGGSAVGAGSSAQMAQASPDIENAYNPLEQANAVLSGIANGTSAIANMTSAMNQALDFVKSVQTFGDFVDLASSTASSARTAADVAAKTKDSQIKAVDAAARSASVAADIAEATKVTAAARQNTANEEFIYGSDFRQAQYDLQQLNAYNAMAASYADIFDPSADDAVISAQLEAEGLTDPQIEALVPRIKHMLSHPETKAKYDAAVVEQRKASAGRQVLSLEFFTRLQENLAQVEQLSAETSLYRSTFENSFAQLFYTEDNAELAASTATTTLGNEQLQSVYNQEETQQKINVLRNDAAAYFAKLDDAKKLTKWIDQNIAQLRDQPDTAENRMLILSLQSQRMQIATASQAELDKIYQHFATAMHTSYVGSRQTLGGKVVPLSSSLNAHTTRFSQFIWRDYVNSTAGEEQPKSILESLLSTVAGKLLKSE